MNLKHPWSGFWRGCVDCSPFVVIVIPYSLLFGVVATDAGLNLFETMSMSVLVIAGVSQFTALALLQDQAPVFIVLLASLAVNLRMAMYSAALVPYLGHASMRLRALMSYLMVDQAYAVAVRAYEADPQMGPSTRVAYYFGCMSMIGPFWYFFTFIGAWAGTAIPASWSLEFAVPICFIALTAPLLQSLSHVLAALAAAVSALVFAFLPWSLGLIVGASVGIVVGAQAELWVNRQARVAHD
ncbi:branched-chain amino acid ABC transporter permease [Litorivicinus lipolyticus]|uniref:Branched-chain amino acid ABC transporter permease n=1 Tax=Litorivicinus lipolyticus TaxID=418701 RepID=A0A5Q2QET3_9GAMM|nr:AzlC family ABC transporter permease [Litorivicinus lipolyticus]QGG79525.1 branched-chain amino acid ABC transporter permease [Litorivicinus lipolyticus]